MGHSGREGTGNYHFNNGEMDSMYSLFSCLLEEKKQALWQKLTCVLFVCSYVCVCVWVWMLPLYVHTHACFVFFRASNTETHFHRHSHYHHVRLTFWLLSGSISKVIILWLPPYYLPSKAPLQHNTQISLPRLEWRVSIWLTAGKWCH